MYLTVEDRKCYAYTANRAFDAEKPTVVFLHGAANDHTVWSLQSRYFAYHGWNALAVDLPGHGKSAGAAIATIGGLADWTASLLGSVKAREVALVGHSMGSLVALESAARHPALIKQIAMIASAVPITVSDALLSTSKANDHAAYEMINLFAHSSAAQLGGNRVPGLWMMGSAMRLMERCGDGVLHADFSACNDYAIGLEQAQKIKCPVLMVLGRRDQMTPMKFTRDVIGKLAHVKVVALDDAGHALMTEKPDEVLDSLVEFLA
jgi:pimeloyl-ACP methyl ester carboxylesterase